MLSSTEQKIDLGNGDFTTLEQWGEGGPALLCVHGIGSSRKSFVRTAEALAVSYRVFAYDQRGHGDSAQILGPMTHEQTVLDLIAVARAVDGGIFVLLGHSWGGTVVLKAGRRVSCKRVVAIDPMIRQSEATWAADFIVDLDPLFASPPSARTGLIREMFAALPTVEVDAKVHALRRMTAEALVELGDANGADAGRWDLREDMLAYPKPLLMLLADPAESVVRPEDVAYVQSHGGPHVTMNVFEGEGHALHRSAFERYISAVRDFLQQE